MAILKKIWFLFEIINKSKEIYVSINEKNNHDYSDFSHYLFFTKLNFFETLLMTFQTKRRKQKKTKDFF